MVEPGRLIWPLGSLVAKTGLGTVDVVVGGAYYSCWPSARTDHGAVVAGAVVAGVAVDGGAVVGGAVDDGTVFVGWLYYLSWLLASCVAGTDVGALVGEPYYLG